MAIGRGRIVQDRYINPLTDFGFKRLFGTEPNKALLIDFFERDFAAALQHQRLELPQ